MLFLSPGLLVATLEAADATPPPWATQASLSFVQTGGNSRSQTLGVEARTRYEADPVKVELRSAFIRNETDDEEASRRLTVALRADRALGSRAAIFARTSFLRDLFAGIESQRLFETGVSAKLLARTVHTLTASGSLGYANEDRIPSGVDAAFTTARVGLLYKLKLGSVSELIEEADCLFDIEDGHNWRANNSVSLSVALSEAFAVKLSHELAYLNKPVPGKRCSDTVLLTSIVAKWSSRSATVEK